MPLLTPEIIELIYKIGFRRGFDNGYKEGNAMATKAAIIRARRYANAIEKDFKLT